MRTPATQGNKPSLHVWRDGNGRLRTFGLSGVAEYCGVSRVTVRLVLTGERNPGPELMVKLRELGIPWRKYASGKA